VINPSLATNGFSFGPDGQLYAPSTDTVPARLLRIDPATGRSTVASWNATLAAGSAKVPPASRRDAPNTVYVLNALPAGVTRVNSGTGTKVGRDISLPFPLADNLTFAPDGRLFVTGFNTPSVAVIAVDGSSRTVPIGRA
jgi:hypothetical protein